MKSELLPYIELLREFGQHKISASNFERRFLNLYKEDRTEWAKEEFLILDELFGSVDAFCSEPDLRDENDVDEAQLLEAVKKAWLRLGQLI